MAWRDIRVLWTREVRSALRERSVVVNSILLPVVLYPFLLWIEISAIAFVSGVSERTPARVEVVGAETGVEAVATALRSAPDSTIHVLGTGSTAAGPLERLGAGDLDAVVEIAPPTRAGAALPENLRLIVHYDRSSDPSRRALARVEVAVEDLRATRLERAASNLALPLGATDPVRVELANVSTDEALGATVLGIMIPLFLVVSVALGCLVPAVDTTAGERERGTWETLMTTTAPRGSVVTAKYLYVATFGAAAGMLNVTALSLSLGPMMAPLQGIDDGGPGLAVRLAPAALAVMAAGAVLLALFFAAAMMPLAAFARTFKDGQALVTPIFYLALLPLLLGQQSDRTLTPALAVVPVANIAMAVRDAIQGVFVWPLLGVAGLVTALLIIVFLAFARWMLGFEDFVVGSHAGGPWRVLRERWSGR